MTVPFRKGRFGVRLAADGHDLAACQALRHQCFFGGDGLDVDHFDAMCDHVMIAGDAGLIGTCRIMRVSGQTVHDSYAAQSYDLQRLSTDTRPMMELGRFCVKPGVADADVLRLAWGALAAIVDAEGIGLIFGCASFPGVDEAPYQDAFGLLRQSHQAPAALAPGRLNGPRLTLPHAPRDRRAAVAALPPLLRSYLAMGGWVSDHAVVDQQMGTLHVFTGLEVDRIPPARAVALRAVAG